MRTQWPWVPTSIDRMLDARAGAVLEPLRAEVFGIARLTWPKGWAMPTVTQD